MARPGLEPGTPRFSARTGAPRVHRSWLKIVVSPVRVRVSPSAAPCGIEVRLRPSYWWGCERICELTCLTTVAYDRDNLGRERNSTIRSMSSFDAGLASTASNVL